LNLTFVSGLSLVNSTAVKEALVTWGHADGILRIKVKKDLPPAPLFCVPHIDYVIILPLFLKHLLFYHYL